MAKIAFRFLPCDERGRPWENSRYTSIHDSAEAFEVGSVIDASVLGYDRWEVVEVRDTSGPLMEATDGDGTPIPLGGTLVCRGVN